MAHHRIALPSGRSLGVSAAGDPTARRLVVLCHPAVGSGPFDPNPVLTSTWGVHVVMLDRPGYGSSDPVATDADATIEQRADDINDYVLLSESAARKTPGITFGTIGVIGWGLGGAIALSLAARHPELVDKVVVVDLPKPSRLEFVLREQVPWVQRRSFSPVTRQSLQEQLAAAPRPDVELLGISTDDPALHAAGLRSRLERMTADAYEQGSAGVATDVVSTQTYHWASALGQITAPTTLVYGAGAVGATAERDGRWYRRHLLAGKVAPVQGSNQLAIVGAWARILSEIARTTAS